VRGRERSRSISTVLDDARSLVADGVKDITLLGQNVNSYGRDLNEGNDFSDVIRRINEIDGDFLIRFMTSHPKDATPRLFDTMAASEKCARQIHLPFQAGNDRVLRAMNRGYTAEAYLKLVEYARAAMPDLVLTSDVIVGFPGETEEEFEDTLKLIETVRFDALFTFLYSKRPGTPAEKLPDPVSHEEKQARFERLVSLQNGISKERHAAYAGKTLRVLVDGEGKDERHTLSGRTNGNRLVHLNGDNALIGTFQNVKITGSSGFALFGELAP
jgi:tRNA-2-methylthio-N6-dimethylallyladenosine synthase